MRLITLILGLFLIGCSAPTPPTEMQIRAEALKIAEYKASCIDFGAKYKVNVVFTYDEVPFGCYLFRTKNKRRLIHLGPDRMMNYNLINYFLNRAKK